MLLTENAVNCYTYNYKPSQSSPLKIDPLLCVVLSLVIPSAVRRNLFSAGTKYLSKKVWNLRGCVESKRCAASPERRACWLLQTRAALLVLLPDGKSC